MYESDVVNLDFFKVRNANTQVRDIKSDIPLSLTVNKARGLQMTLFNFDPEPFIPIYYALIWKKCIQAYLAYLKQKSLH